MKWTNEMEIEVQRRVWEKLDAIEAHLKANAKSNHKASFEATLGNNIKEGQKYFEKHIGFKWMEKLFQKEREMLPIPTIQRLKERRNQTVDKLLMILHPEERRKVRQIVSIIEECLVG
jgi:hypothetical protein